MGFNLTKCNFCGECLAQCPYSDFTLETGADEIRKLIKGEPTKITKECITCFMCNTVCPTGAQPFDLVLWRMEEEGYEITEAFRKLARSQEDTKMFPNRVVQEGKPGMPTLNTCCFTEFIPRLFEGQLFEDLKIIAGGGYEGQLAYNHMGKRVPRDFLQKQTNNIAATGAKEVIFFHDDDYESFAIQALNYEINVPFRCLPMTEYLRNYLKAHPDRIKKKLNLKVAYQLSCSQRYSPWQDKYVDEILEMIGCKRVKRTYDHENQLCCQCIVSPRRGKEYGDANKKRNIDDAKNAGAEVIVFNCGICCWSLRDEAKAAGMEPYIHINLVRLALGEELPAGGVGLGDKNELAVLGTKVIRGEIEDF